MHIVINAVVGYLATHKKAERITCASEPLTLADEFCLPKRIAKSLQLLKGQEAKREADEGSHTQLLPTDAIKESLPEDQPKERFGFATTCGEPEEVHAIIPWFAQFRIFSSRQLRQHTHDAHDL